MVAEPGSLGRSLACHQRLRLSSIWAYFKFLGFSLLLDDHGVFQSMRVVKRIQLGLFDVRKGSGEWEGRVHCGNDICFRCSLSMRLLYRSPFVMYFALSKVSS